MKERMHTYLDREDHANEARGEQTHAQGLGSHVRELFQHVSKMNFASKYFHYNLSGSDKRKAASKEPSRALNLSICLLIRCRTILATTATAGSRNSSLPFVPFSVVRSEYDMCIWKGLMTSVDVLRRTKSSGVRAQTRTYRRHTSHSRTRAHNTSPTQRHGRHCVVLLY